MICYKLPEDYTIVDIETTGLSPEKNDIIEIAALRIREGKPADEFSRLIKISAPLSPTIVRITGITDEMLNGGIELSDALESFLRFAGDDVIAGHNVTFDTHFISGKCDTLFNHEFENDIYDTLTECKRIYPGVSHTLEDMITQIGLEDNGNHHRALADCYHTYNLISALQNPPELKIAIMSSGNKIPTSNPITKGLQTLQGILIGITCDDVLTKEELLRLNEWLNNNETLKGNFPYDIIYDAVCKVLEDGIIEQSELDFLLGFFKQQIDPISTESSDTDIDLNRKAVCITGDFDGGSRDEILEKLEIKGAIISNNVTRKTDILLVGSKGSDKWSNGNYGNKVKKALELQEKGHKIIIIKESDVQL